jgi:thymidylate synthase (FAD)
MNVCIISPFFKDCLLYLAETARICHGREGIYLLQREKPLQTEEFYENALKTVTSALERGHHSIFEGITVEWYVRNISRAASHQIVRHRLTSPLQQSQRYVAYGADSEEFWQNMVIPKLDYMPPSAATEAKKLIYAHLEEVQKLYITLITSLGVRPEDARSILPQCSPTTLKIGMNLREFLFNFYPLRTARGAQEEIKEMTYDMYYHLEKDYKDDKYFTKFLNVIYPEWLARQQKVRKEWC